MKKTSTIVSLLAMLVLCLTSCGGGDKIVLNVYNWGEYISDGSDDSIDVIEEFEKISGINVNYTLFDTNEDMYAKIIHGGSQYDIIIPSDYMVARLINENRLEALNYDNIPNIKYIYPEYHKTDFDPEDPRKGLEDFSGLY